MNQEKQLKKLKEINKSNSLKKLEKRYQIAKKFNYNISLDGLKVIYKNGKKGFLLQISLSKELFYNRWKKGLCRIEFLPILPNFLTNFFADS